MLIPHPRDAIHRSWMLRLLSAIADDRVLMKYFCFKGGTCAAMRDLLDRFSVDLDFDLLSKEDINSSKEHLEAIFSDLHLQIKDQSAIVPQYFLHYDAKEGNRKNIALDITVPPPQSNTYEIVHFPDIDRSITCQTIPTMVANKLATPLDRFAQHGTVAGRDIYDIHHFLFHGFPYEVAVIEERADIPIRKFFRLLRDFVDEHVTQTVIDQDLNPLLLPEQFRRIRKILKEETLMLLRQAGKG